MIMSDIYKEKLHYSQLLAILSVSTIFLFVIFLTVTISYFSQTKNSSGEIVLGELDFCLYETGTGGENIVPGAEIDKQIKLVNARNISGTNKNNLCSIFIKFSINSSEIISPYFEQQNNWTVDGNDYYFNRSVSPGETINLCDKLIFSVNAGNEYQNQMLDITFNVSAIQAENNAYVELWPNAPQSWKNIVSS